MNCNLQQTQNLEIIRSIREYTSFRSNFFKFIYILRIPTKIAVS